MEVAMYLRVSTGKQLDGAGLGVQEEAITQYCSLRGWQVVQRYQDVYTGTSDQRPQLQALLAAAAQGAFKAVVFYDLTRFARNTLHLLQLVELLEGYKVRICSVKDGIDAIVNPAVGQLILTILGAFAQWEHATIVRRMHEARHKTWRDGKAYMGRPPVGYQVVNGQLVIDDVYAPIVQRIFKLYLSGLAMGAIGQRLRAEGLRTPAGKWYTSGGISHILRNRLYTGSDVANQYVYEGNRATEVLKPASEHIHIEAPALISQATWQAVQAKISQRKGVLKRAGGLQWAWLRDSLRCGICCGPVRPTVGGKRKNGTRVRYYTCTWRRQSKRVLMEAGRSRCTMPLIRAEELHGLVWARIMEKVGLMGNRAQLKALIDPARYKAAISQAGQVVANWEREVTRLNTARANLYNVLEGGALTEEVREGIAGRLNANQAAIAAAQGSLMEAQGSLEALVAAQANDRQVQLWLRDHQAALRGLVNQVAGFNEPQRYQLVNAMLAGPVIIGHGGAVQLNTLKLELNLTVLGGILNLPGLCPLTGRILTGLLNA